MTHGCPHKNMHDCPRYVASHDVGNRWACISGDLVEPCLVRSEKLPYDEEAVSDLYTAMEAPE